MLSRTGSGRGLVCSDCGTPVRLDRLAGKPHPAGSALMLLGFGAFSVLLFLLTYRYPRPAEPTSERGMINKVTTGAFAEETELLERGSHREEE